MDVPAGARGWRPLIRSLLRARLALGGLLFLALVFLVAVFAPWLAPRDPTAIDITARLKPPIWMEGGDPRFWLGSDALGRDILSHLMYGARISLLVGLSSVLISGFLGVTLGLFSGYYRGKLDHLLMGVADIQLAFPFILLAITLMAVAGPGLLNVILVLGVSRWVAYGRVVRGQVLAVREREFVEAARAAGYRALPILFLHILPNVMAPVIVIGSFAVAGNIVSEAALSFLGLGIPPSIPTWGGMLAEGRAYIRLAWWMATFPGLAIMGVVLGINLVGDWLRDYLDPRLRTEA
ncbi:MAG: ABC transporter permease [Nitrospinota bacterium]